MSAHGSKLNNAIADYMSAIGGRRDAETDADTPAMGMPDALALGE